MQSYHMLEIIQHQLGNYHMHTRPRYCTASSWPDHQLSRWDHWTNQRRLPQITRKSRHQLVQRVFLTYPKGNYHRERERESSKPPYRVTVMCYIMHVQLCFHTNRIQCLAKIITLWPNLPELIFVRKGHHSLASFQWITAILFHKIV